MSRIRGKDTKPEILVRSMLHNCGLRFTVNGLKNRLLPGKPDIVLPARKVVVFVHGCFWHGHTGCPNFRIPKTRRQWWKTKIESNQSRDRSNMRLLKESGWKVIVIWECTIKELARKSAVELRDYILKCEGD